MLRLKVLKRDRDYYWGLGLLLLSCLSLVWALVRDAFKPNVFLTGFIIFACGYAFLWRYDLKQSIAALQAEVADLRAQLASAEPPPQDSTFWAQELLEITEAVQTDGDESELESEPEKDQTLLPNEF